MTIVESGQYFELAFEYRSSIVSAVKGIEGARYYPPNKSWRVPKRKEKEVIELGKKFGAITTDNSPQEIGVLNDLQMPPVEFMESLRAKIKREPYDYQWKGIWAGFNMKTFLNGDQPGLGKTGQSILTILAANSFPCLVVCPSVLKENWKREWEIWTGKRAIVLDDKVKLTWPQYHKAGGVDIFITNYESMKKYFVSSIDTPKGDRFMLKHIKFYESINLFKSVIFDEAHKLKDGTTKQSKFGMGISKGKEYIIELSGTPVKNKPKDLIAQLHILGRLADFGGIKHFNSRYCAGGSGASNLMELNYKLNQICFFRREKKEVLNDLPDKMRNVVICDIDNRQEYDKAVKDFQTYLLQNGCSDAEVRKKMKAEIMVKIGVLKSLSAQGRLSGAVEHIEEVVEAGEKIVVFVHSKIVAQHLMVVFPKAVSVRGGDKPQERQNAIDHFQNDPKVQIIICSIMAAGTGLTLTASSRVLFVELPWTPADVEQCEDRCHRIGQKDSVQITYLLGKSTIDEYIYKIIETKREISNTILGANDDTQVMVEDITKNLFNI